MASNKCAVQDKTTGKLFAGLEGVSDVRWTTDKNEAYELAPGQAAAVIRRLLREGQQCKPHIIPFPK